MDLPQFLQELVGCEGTLSVSNGMVTFPDGRSFDVANVEKVLPVEVHDWRNAEWSPEDVPPELTGLGKLVLKEAGYGAQLDVTTPDGRKCALNMEFDAGALKVSVYPTDSTTRHPMDDVPVATLALVDDGVVVSSNYGACAALYQAEGRVSDCPHYDGQAVLDKMKSAQ